METRKMRFKVGEEVISTVNDEYYKIGALGTIEKVLKMDYLVQFHTGEYQHAPEKASWYVFDEKLEHATKLHKLLAGIDSES